MTIQVKFVASVMIIDVEEGGYAQMVKIRQAGVALGEVLGAAQREQQQPRDDGDTMATKGSVLTID